MPSKKNNISLAEPDLDKSLSPPLSPSSLTTFVLP